MSWRRHFRAFAQSTEPRAGDVRRVVERVSWPRTLARAVRGDPAPGATLRLVQRLRAPRRAPFPWRAIGLATLALSAAALAVMMVRTGDPSAPIQQDLAADALRALALTPQVHAEFQGSGRAEGTVHAPLLRWESGTLSLDVEPHRGIDLTVETPEGTIQVVGTAFTVTRDALGTVVRVARGEVAVQCVGEPPLEVRAGEETLCLPARSVGMLTRTQRLLDLGSDPQSVLVSVERGLRLANAGDPAVGELLAVRIRVLMQLGRVDEARRDAERYVALGGPRTEEVRVLLLSVDPEDP